MSDTLAGRAVYLELPPFCPAERLERKDALTPLDRLFAADFDWREWPDEPGNWTAWLLRGGFPPALQIDSEADRGLSLLSWTEKEETAVQVERLLTNVFCAYMLDV